MRQRVFTRREVTAAMSMVVGLTALGVLPGCAGPDRAPVIAPAVKASAPVVSGTATPDPGAASPTEHPPSATYIAECVDDNLVQWPKTLTLTCADGNESLEGLTWTGWGETSAKATGQISTNTCEPDCSQGTIKRYPVTAVAGKPDRREAAEFYTELVVTYTGDRPAGVPASQTYQLMTPPK